MSQPWFLPARHFQVAHRTKVDLVVIHSADIGESLDGAEALARGFARQRFLADGRENKSSAHFNVDADSITQSVLETDIANHAPGVNPISIGIELCGRARQTEAEWADEFSRNVVIRAASLTADICRRRGIPVVFVPADGLLRGGRGITTHAEVSKAFKRSSHSDPGPAFPLQRFLDLARHYLTQVA